MGPIVIVTQLCYWYPNKLHDRVRECNTGYKGMGHLVVCKTGFEF